MDRKLEDAEAGVNWDDEAVAELEGRFGKDLAADLIDLGTLYKQFEHYGSYPWLICNAAVDEASVLRNEKGERLRRLLSFFRGTKRIGTMNRSPGFPKAFFFRAVEIESRRSSCAPWE